MFAQLWRLTLLAAFMVLPGLLLPASAGAGDDDDKPEVIAPPPRAVRDHLEVFSPAARAKANLALAEFRNHHKTDLVVETLQVPPLPDSIKASDEKAVSAFYFNWLKKKAKDTLGSQGILIVFLPREAKSYCLVGPETQKIFSTEKAQDLAKKIKPKLVAKEYDAALESALDLVRAGLPKLTDTGVKTDSDSWFRRFLESEDDPGLDAKEKPSSDVDRKVEVPFDKVSGPVLPPPGPRDEEKGEVLEPPTPAIRDEMKVFSPAARVKANQAVAKIRETHGFKLIVEARKAPELPAGVDRKDPKALNKAYEEVIAKHAKGVLGKEGILITIFPEGPRSYCHVGPVTQKIFSAEKARKVPDEIKSRLLKKDYDGALDAAVAYVSFALPPVKAGPVKTDSDTWFGRKKGKEKEGAAAGGKGEEPTPWLTYILIALGVLVGLWIIMAIIRGLSNRNRAPVPGNPATGAPGNGAQGYPQSGGGGGFMRGLLGGLVGAAAGMWLYNSFFSSHSSAAMGGDHSPSHSDPTSSDAPGATDPGDTGRDWEGGGGDHGSSGGDAGGGAWGGGGDDWGGGGGDWGGGGE